jgi:hypothetical protein
VDLILLAWDRDQLGVLVIVIRPNEPSGFLAN